MNPYADIEAERVAGRDGDEAMATVITLDLRDPVGLPGRGRCPRCRAPLDDSRCRIARGPERDIVLCFGPARWPAGIEEQVSS